MTSTVSSRSRAKYRWYSVFGKSSRRKLGRFGVGCGSPEFGFDRSRSSASSNSSSKSDGATGRFSSHQLFARSTCLRARLPISIFTTRFQSSEEFKGILGVALLEVLDPLLDGSV